MATHIYLKLDSINGDVTVKGYANQIEVLSYSFGISEAVTGGAGAGSGAGKPTFSDLSLTKRLDPATIPILQRLVTGEHVATGTITVTTAGADGAATVAETIVFKNILFSSYTQSDATGDTTPSESLGFTFQEVTYKVGTATFTYNVATNKTS